MKGLKKLFGVVVAAVCGVCINLPLVAFSEGALDDSPERAPTYDPCDVNHDGYVDIMDYMRVNKYISGIQAVTHAEYLDANLNNVVDITDAEKIWATLYGRTYTWNYVDITANGSKSLYTESSDYVGSLEELQAVFNYDNNLSILDSATRNYTRYHLASGGTPAYTEPYSLTTTYASNSKDMSSLTNTYYTNLIGNSENGIVRLVQSSSTSPNQYCGTGFIIDDHRIVTSAHCVYNKGNSTNQLDITKFVPDLQIQLCDSTGNLSSTKYNVKEIHIPTLFATTPYDSQYIWQNYDYALLTVNESLSNYQHFNIGTPVNVTSTGFMGMNLFMSGFPESLMGNQQVYTSKGHGYSDSTNLFLSYTNPSGGGFSGSPVYVATHYTVNESDNSRFEPIDKTIYTAVAVHGFGGGYGPAMNELLITFYLQGSTNVGY